MVQKANTDKKEVTITGVPLVTDYNRHGKILEIVIETEDFQQYIIYRNAVCDKLYNHISKVVTANGVIIGKNSSGNPILELTKFTLSDNGSRL